MFDPALFKLPGMRRAATILGLLAIVEGICIVFQAYYLSVAIVGLWHLHSLASAHAMVRISLGRTAVTGRH